MPRCFMAKKLKYPYEQWKEQQNKPPSRSPSPMEAVEDEGFSSSSSSPQTILPNSSSMSDFRSESFSPRHVYGKWCSMLHDLLMIIFFYFVLLTEKQLLHILVTYSGSRLICRFRLKRQLEPMVTIAESTTHILFYLSATLDLINLIPSTKW